MTAIARVTDLRAAFGSTTVLHGVEFEIEERTVTALLGLNGAGKSVTLKCISGLVPASGGSVVLDGRELLGLDAADRVRAGLGHVLQARAVFPELSVEQNLRVGGATLRGRNTWRDAADRVFGIYPALVDRRRVPAGALSGGEQAMLAVGRALMTSPRLLLVDEPSAGLSPVMIGQLITTLLAVKEAGTTVLLVEQNVNAALRIADRVLVLERGRVVYEGDSSSLDTDRLAELLGIGELLTTGAAATSARRPPVRNGEGPMA